ncbi:hypothetical protein MTO96_010493 [Rhipicephalus appendiculatus]
MSRGDRNGSTTLLGSDYAEFACDLDVAPSWTSQLCVPASYTSDNICLLCSTVRRTGKPCCRGVQEVKAVEAGDARYDTSNSFDWPGQW